ncbi:MAG: hypothetical protein ACM31C_03445 [Acidobacteriota bacterium]
MADDAGALLVRSGLVSASALEEARSRVADAGGTVGEQLVAVGVLGDDVLTDFYKSRLLVPQVNPNTLARLPAKVVAVIPSDMAIELRSIPVSLDKDNNLTVAMSDPSDRHAVDEIAFFTGAYVVRAVATQMQIAWCLAHYYGHVTHLGQRLLQPNAQQPSRALQAAVKAPTRKRGVTGKVEATRHKAIVPGASIEVARPTSDVLDEPTIPTPVIVPPETGADEAEASAAPEAVPEPRARSQSGEIRVPLPRAPSIKPVLPDFEHESGPVVITVEAPEPSAPMVIEMEADDPTSHSKPVPRRTRPAEPDPPELVARGGEIEMKSAPHVAPSLDEEPRIVLDEELERAAGDKRSPTASGSIEISGELSVPPHDDHPVGPQITVEIAAEVVDEPSAPVVILDRKRQDDAADDVVVLESKKPGSVSARRAERRTQMGIGVIAAATKARPSDGDAVPTELDDQPTAARSAVDSDPTRVDAHAVPPGDFTTSDEILAAPPSPVADDDTSPIALPPIAQRTLTPVPPPSGKVKLDNVRPRAPSIEDDDDEAPGVRGKPTEVMAAISDDEVDDGWGPPGTTIPPPLLGPVPGTDDRASGMIPIPNIDSQPLMVAPPVAPEVSRPDLSAQALGRALEEATALVFDLIRALDRANDRDTVVTIMVEHLAQTHRRAGFFAVRAGELSLFAMAPPPHAMPAATLRLDRPSTLQDVVDTRLPYRGPMHDDTSRTFLAAVLGASPAEILLVPVTVRERVVGVLFGEQRMRHTFDDQLALAARAAGVALERILKARRG